MASKIETGHAKNVANFETLIIYSVGFGTTYQPSNPMIALPALRLKLDSAKVQLNAVNIAKPSLDEADGTRTLVFKTYRKLSTRIMGAITSSGAPSTTIDDARTINRRMQGARAPGSKGKPKEESNSVSQQSFDMRIEHLDKMVEFLTKMPDYNPNEEDLKIVGLRDYKTLLTEANNRCKNAYVPYKNSIIKRNKSCYEKGTGLVDIALMTKEYIKSIFGATSPEYKMVSKLKFRNLE